LLQNVTIEIERVNLSFINLEVKAEAFLNVFFISHAECNLLVSFELINFLSDKLKPHFYVWVQSACQFIRELHTLQFCT